MVVVLEFWAGDMNAPWWFSTETDFIHTAAVLLNATDNAEARIVFFGDVPTLPIEKLPSNNLLKNYVYQRGKLEGFEFMQHLREDPAYRVRRLGVEAAIAAAAESKHFGERMRFQKMAWLFTSEQDENLQLIDPVSGKLVYKDFSHVNIDGAKRAELVFRDVVFNDTNCTARGSHSFK